MLVNALVAYFEWSDRGLSEASFSKIVLLKLWPIKGGRNGVQITR